MRKPVESLSLRESEKLLDAMFYAHEHYMESDHRIPYSEEVHMFAMNRLSAQVKRLREGRRQSHWLLSRLPAWV